MLVVKGAIIDHYSTSGKGYGRGRMFGDAGNNTEATFSLFEVTLLQCYTLPYTSTSTYYRTLSCPLENTHNLTQQYNIKFQNFELTFPIENTILTCYKERTSCVENDFQTEVKGKPFVKLIHINQHSNLTVWLLAYEYRQHEEFCSGLVGIRREHWTPCGGGRRRILKFLQWEPQSKQRLNIKKVESVVFYAVILCW